MPTLKDVLVGESEKPRDNYEICGIVDRARSVYPLDSDTKVLSTVFELITRPAIYAAAQILGYKIIEPTVQNHYPDLTLLHHCGDNKKIAIDVKTTYRRKGKNTFSYTLGGYTSFIRIGNEQKNIVFPFNEYARHLVIGFVYDRISQNEAGVIHKYTIEQLTDIPLPIKNVEFFVQDKWRISSDRAGSGNTTNIGSINGTIDDFRIGKGPFQSEKKSFLSIGVHTSEQPELEPISQTLMASAASNKGSPEANGDGVPDSTATSLERMTASVIWLRNLSEEPT